MNAQVDATTDDVAVPAKKKKRPDRKPKFKVGDIITTKYPAKVKQSGPRGRKFLTLLSGCKWTVSAVQLNGPNAPIYTLTVPGFGLEIVRQEWRVRPLERR